MFLGRTKAEAQARINLDKLECFACRRNPDGA